MPFILLVKHSNVTTVLKGIRGHSNNYKNSNLYTKFKLYILCNYTNSSGIILYNFRWKNLYPMFDMVLGCHPKNMRKKENKTEHHFQALMAQNGAAKFYIFF